MISVKSGKSSLAILPNFEMYGGLVQLTPMPFNAGGAIRLIILSASSMDSPELSESTSWYEHARHKYASFGYFVSKLNYKEMENCE